MPPTLVTVTGKLSKPDGTDWANAPVVFSLSPGSQALGEHFPAHRKRVLTNATGDISVSLWANDEGDFSSEYFCELPSGETRVFILPVAPASQNINDLFTLYAGPNDPNYAPLATYVNTQVDIYGRSVRRDGAVGTGLVDDRAAFVACEAASDFCYVPAGTYLIGAALTLSKAWKIARGGKLKPAAGVVITIAGSLDVGDYQCFDISAGGQIVYGADVHGRESRVVWFGAAGDGVTDDTTPITEAYRMVGTNGGGVVKFSAADYRVDGQFLGSFYWGVKVQWDNTTFRGEGWSHTSIKPLRTGVPANCFTAESGTHRLNVGWQDMKIIGNGHPDWYGGSGIRVDWFDGLEITRCRFEDNTTAGFHSGSSTTQSTNLRIRHNYVLGGAGRSGNVPAVAFVVFHPKGAWIEENVIDGVAIGVGLEPKGGKIIEDVWVQRNLIKNGRSTNWDATNVYLGVQIQPEDAGTTCRRIFVRDNSFIDNYNDNLVNSGHDIYIGTQPGVSFVHGITISGNKFVNSKNDATSVTNIWVSYGEHCIITDNQGYDAGKASSRLIVLNGAKFNKVQGNEVYGVNYAYVFEEVNAAAVALNNRFIYNVGPYSVPTRATSKSAIINNLRDTNAGEIISATEPITHLEGQNRFSSGITIGAGQAITKYIAMAPTADFASIPANSVGAVDVTVTGVALGDTIIAAPYTQVAGLVPLPAVYKAANTVTLRMWNTTAAAVDPAADSWRVSVFRHT